MVLLVQFSYRKPFSERSLRKPSADLSFHPIESQQRGKHPRSELSVLQHSRIPWSHHRHRNRHRSQRLPRMKWPRPRDGRRPRSHAGPLRKRFPPRCGHPHSGPLGGTVHREWCPLPFLVPPFQFGRGRGRVGVVPLAGGPSQVGSRSHRRRSSRILGFHLGI